MTVLKTKKVVRLENKLTKNLQSNTLLYNKEVKKVTLLFGSRCVFKCKHCFNWRFKNNFDRISLEEWISLLENIKKLNKGKVKIDIGASGMALLSEYLIPVVMKCNQLGYKILLNTNGYLFNERIVKKLVKSGLNKFSISIDFFSPKKHDDQKGMVNSHKHALNLIRYVKKHSGSNRISISTIIMKPNLNELVPLIKWTNSMNIPIFFQAITQPYNTPDQKYWYKDNKYKNLWPGDSKKMSTILDKIIELRKKGYNVGNDVNHLHALKKYFLYPQKRIMPTCNINNVGLLIDSSGCVKACPYMENIDNLRNVPITSLVESQKYIKTINKMCDCPTNCAQMINCSYKDYPVSLIE